MVLRVRGLGLAPRSEPTCSYRDQRKYRQRHGAPWATLFLSWTRSWVLRLVAYRAGVDVRESRQRLAAVLALSVVLGCLPRSAAADAFGYPTPGFVADGADHWYCFGAVSDGGQQTVISSSMSYLDDRTDMYDGYASSCSSATDIVWVAADLGDARGRTTCVNWASWGVCDQYWLAFDPAIILQESAICSTNPGESYQVNLIKSVRHELGHSTGLSHPGTPVGCAGAGSDAMRSGWVPTSLAWTAYNDHHRDHINAQYP